MILWKKMDYEQKSLCLLMMDVSECRWFAAWYEGLEFILWDACYGEDKDGLKEKFPDEIKQIRRRAAEVGGWIIYSQEHEECYVNNDEWARIRVEHYFNQKRETGTHGQPT